MRSFDLVFVGNGILTMVSCLRAKQEFPDLRIAVIGRAIRPFSASLAAGAMQAVFCEVEETFRDLERDREIFTVALEARHEWHKLLKSLEMTNVITAEHTIMYRRKNGTPFEKVNFEAACSVARDYNCIEDVQSSELEGILCGQLRPHDVVAKRFLGEFALDTDAFFQGLQEKLERADVTFIDAEVLTLSTAGSNCDIKLTSGETLSSARAVLAAGSKSAELLAKRLPIVPIYHAVGTAMVLDSAPSRYTDFKTVIRTPNRGGAQCGMHIVPRTGGNFYLGAGNYLSDKTPAHRVETIRYLIEICESELFGKQVIYGAKADLKLGSRPKSLDGYPIVGSYTESPQIFVATGMYRIGLTIAPVIANEICRWLETSKSDKKFAKWSPERQLHSYAPLATAVRYYSESRISNLVEHGLLDFEDSSAVAAKKIELEKIARDLNAQIVRKHGFHEDFVVDPDMYAILAASNPL